MLRTIKTASWFFLFGLAFGILIAPRSGHATRRMMVRSFGSLLSIPPEEMLIPGEEAADRIPGPVIEMQQTQTQLRLNPDH